MTFPAWLAKSYDSKEQLEFESLPIFKTKGKREDWHKDDWPPLKVTIIVEEKQP